MPIFRFALTPVLPTHEVVLRVFGINAALVLIHIGIVAWQARRMGQ